MIRWSSWNVYEQNKLGRNIKYNKSMKILKSLVKSDSSKMDLLSVNNETKNFLTIQGYEGIWKTNNRGKIIISILFFLLSNILLVTVYFSYDVYVICTLRTQAKLIFRHTQNQCLALKVLMTSSVQEVLKWERQCPPCFLCKSQPKARHCRGFSEQCESKRTKLRWPKITWSNKISYVSREWNLPLCNVKVQCIIQG